MPNRRSLCGDSPHPEPRRLHPALAVAMALALHAGLFAAVRWHEAPEFALATPDGEVAVELALDDAASPAAGAAPSPITDATPGPSPEPAARSTAPRKEHARASAVPSDSAAGTPSDVLVAEGSAAELAAPDTGASPDSSAPPGTAPRAIDLGLNDGVRRAALQGGWLEPVTPAKPPSDGGLSAGLAALDAQRGQSKSNAANHAAYQAARRFAPPQGMGVFDIVTDEHGAVLSVTLASAPADEARWQRVGAELRDLLKDRRLRVPQGAKGLAARLRIETGDLAKEIAARFRRERGAALGQAPLHARELRAESTRESLDPGKLSPTLGVTLAGGSSGSGENIHVVLLSERPL